MLNHLHLFLIRVNRAEFYFSVDNWETGFEDWFQVLAQLNDELLDGPALCISYRKAIVPSDHKTSNFRTYEWNLNLQASIFT
jgi:hypothetical protein